LTIVQVGLAPRDFKWLRPDHPVGFGWMTQDLNPSGAVGDATLATAAKGEAALAFVCFVGCRSPL
jgi:creatinine amidohydrolase/Fe(II)-dependent formamide hydrolase-like protein